MDENPATTITSAQNTPKSSDGSNTRIGGLSHPDYVTDGDKVLGIAGNGIMESLTTKPFVYDQRPVNNPQIAADMDHLNLRTSEFVNFITSFEHELDISTKLGAVVAFVKAHMGHGLPQWAKDQIANGAKPPLMDGDEDSSAEDPFDDEPVTTEVNTVYTAQVPVVVTKSGRKVKTGNGTSLAPEGVQLSEPGAPVGGPVDPVVVDPVTGEHTPPATGAVTESAAS